MKGGGVDEKTAGYYLSMYGLLFMIGRFAGTAIMRFVKPAKLLSIYTVAAILLSVVAMFTEGKFVVLALGGLGFFMSIMFPTIFSLGIMGLKRRDKTRFVVDCYGDYWWRDFPCYHGAISLIVRGIIFRRGILCRWFVTFLCCILDLLGIK